MYRRFWKHKNKIEITDEMKNCQKCLTTIKNNINYDIRGEIINNEHVKYIHDNSEKFDEKTEEYVEPILSEKFLIDVVWNGIEEHPYGWKSYAVTPSGEPVHNFYGIDYLENKM